jgi:response regulator RpfG family c-di-GMP phosphodiesterase
MDKQDYMKPKVLLVEDKPEWQAIFKKTIGANYEVKEADNIRDAERAILETTNNAFALAIVDIRLLPDKDNQDGLLILQSLQEKGVPTIATSAYASPEIVRDSFILGKVRDFWFKDDERVAEWRGDIHKILTEVRQPTHAHSSTSEAVSPREIFIQRAAEDYHQATLAMLKEPQAQLQRLFATTLVFIGLSLVLIVGGAMGALFWRLELGTLTSVNSIITGAVSTLLLRQLNSSKKDFEVSRNKVLELYKTALEQLYGKENDKK